MDTFLKNGTKVVGNFLILGVVTASSAFLAILAQEMTTRVVETTLESFTGQKTEEKKSPNISNVA